MTPERDQVETLQRLVAETIAKSHVGVGLCLIGGFRLRLLDNSARWSTDIDYHWDGDLAAKQAELVAALRKELVPRVRQITGWACTIEAQPESEADARLVRTVEVTMHAEAGSIVIPVDVLNIPCADSPETRTLRGTVYLSVSDEDVIESKILSVMGPRVAVRDLVDLALYESALRPDSRDRVLTKLEQLHPSPVSIEAGVARLRRDLERYVASATQIIKSQMDPASARQILDHDGVRDLVTRAIRIVEDHAAEYVKKANP
jgi:hypothetical protein